MIHPEPSLSFKTTVSLDIDGNIRIAGDEKSVVFNRAGEEKDNFVDERKFQRLPIGLRGEYQRIKKLEMQKRRSS